MTKAESAGSRTQKTHFADDATLAHIAALELEAADLQRQVKGVIQALTDAGFKYPVYLDHTEQDGTPVRDKLTLGFTVMLAFDDLRERLAKARAETMEEWAATFERDADGYVATGFGEDHYCVAVRRECARHMRMAIQDEEEIRALAHDKGDGNG